MSADYIKLTDEELLELMSSETIRYNQMITGLQTPEELQTLRHQIKAMVAEFERRKKLK